MGELRFKALICFKAPSKGNPVNIPGLGYGKIYYDGNVKECGDAGMGPGRSFLFLLTP